MVQIVEKPATSDETGPSPLFRPIKRAMNVMPNVFAEGDGVVGVNSEVLVVFTKNVCYYHIDFIILHLVIRIGDA